MIRNVFIAAAVMTLFFGFINLSVDATNCSSTTIHTQLGVEFFCNSVEIGLTGIGLTFTIPDDRQQMDVSWTELQPPAWVSPQHPSWEILSVWVGLYTTDEEGNQVLVNDAYIDAPIPTSLTFYNMSDAATNPEYDPADDPNMNDDATNPDMNDDDANPDMNDDDDNTIRYGWDKWYRVVVVQTHEMTDPVINEVYADYDFRKYWVGHWFAKLLVPSGDLDEELSWVEDYLERYNGDRTEDLNWTNPDMDQLTPDPQQDTVEGINAPVKQRRLTTTWAALKTVR